MHTPGPWTIGKIKKSSIEIDAIKGDRRIDYSSWHGLANVYGSKDFPSRVKPIMHANARLIASAPDLLKALECLMTFVSNSCIGSSNAELPAMRDMARAAIDKARGVMYED